MSDIYLIYLRKSRADNAEESVEETLNRHERQLQEHAVKMLGRKIEEKYIYREVVSGETIEDRPEIKKVLSMIESDNIKGVLVIEPQRLSRGDWEDGGKILTSFKYSHTLVITPQKTYDLNNKFDYKFFKMELSQGNDYLEYVKEILIRGRIASTKEGNYIGSIAPYGFKKTFIDKCPTIEEYTPEAFVVRLASEKRTKYHLGWAIIGDQLDKAGYKPRNGEHWNPYTLKSICLNPVNVGLIKWNERQIVKVYEEGKIKITRPRNKKAIYVKGKHQGILDQKTYDTLVAMDGIGTREKKASKLVNPLAGLVYCKKCGHAMTYRTYKRKDGTIKCDPRLLCTNQKHCNTKSSTFFIVYNSVISSLENIITDFKLQLKNDTNDNYNLQTKMIKEANKELEKLEEKQEKLYELLEDKIYTKDVFLKRNAKLAEEREQLEKQIEYLKNNVSNRIDYEEKIMLFTDIINSLKDDTITAKEKNILLKNIIERIEYTRDSTNRTRWDTSKPEIYIKLKDF
ncbi:recombinase family protein [Thomasclavelia cocleata]|uniref:recombinase family protein n=1 Tax=Thomasclavelia cocleata TaxID=69824 RepID=UPI0024321DD5|nr:recombinase family protein [Thomasclavelia cocleata]